MGESWMGVTHWSHQSQGITESGIQLDAGTTDCQPQAMAEEVSKEKYYV